MKITIFGTGYVGLVTDACLAEVGLGFINILEGCRHSKVKHLVFTSSSSVHSANSKLPFSESDNVDHPVSLVSEY